MIRKLLVLTLALIVGGVAYATAHEAAAPETRARKSSSRTHRVKAHRKHKAKSHRAHRVSRSSRRHTHRAAHAAKAKPAAEKTPTRG